MYKSILLAADGSENSFRAAEEILNFVNEDTTVTILNVIQIEKSKDAVLHSENTIKQQKEKITKIINLYESNNVDYNVILEKGLPDEIALKLSNSSVYDIVVLGSRGLNALQEVMIGSVSKKVVKRADIPVMVVK